MRIYGYTPTSAASRPVSRLPSVPFAGGGGSTSSYGARMFPERVSLNDPFGTAEDYVARGVAMAAQAPGYVYERPFALANALTGGDNGIISQLQRAIDGLPVIGDFFRGLSGGLEQEGRIVPSILNSRTARDLREHAGQPDDTPLSSGPFGLPFGQYPDLDIGAEGIRLKTVGDLRADARKRGFTPEEIRDIEAGRRSDFDFADKSTIGDPLLDMGARIALDPINVVMGAGIYGGAAAKVGKILGLAEARAAAAATITSRVALGATEGAATLAQGSIVGVTRQALGTFLMEMGSKGGTALRYYRRAAIGTTAAQLGLNAIGDYARDNGISTGPLKGIFDLGRAMAEDKPFSENLLWNWWAVTHFPVRGMLGAVNDKGRVLWYSKTASTVEADALHILSRYAHRPVTRAEVVERMGAQRWMDTLGRAAGRVVLERGYVPPSTMLRRGSSYAEMTAMADDIDRSIGEISRYQLSRGRLGGRDIGEEIVAWVKGARGIKDMTGVEVPFDMEDFYTVSASWDPIAQRISEIHGKASVIVAGVNDNHLSDAQLDVVRATFRGVADDEGMVGPEAGRRIVLAFPSLLKYETKSGTFARFLIRDAEPVPLSWVEQRLDAAYKNAPSQRDIYADTQAWEAKAARERAARQGVLGPDGMPDRSRLPTEGSVVVEVPTSRDVARGVAGFPDTTIEQVAAQRGSAAVQAVERDVPAVLNDHSYDVDFAAQGIVVEGGVMRAGLTIRGDHATVQELAEVAALALERSKSRGAARIVVRGLQAIRKRSLTPNAIEARWDLPVNDRTVTGRVAAILRREFGEAFINDTHGVYRIVAKGDEVTDEALSRVVTELAGIFPDRAVNGRVLPKTQPVWTQTIRRSAGRGLSRGRSRGVLGADRSTADIARSADRSIRWHAARRDLDELRHGSENVAGGGPVEGPVGVPDGGPGRGGGLGADGGPEPGLIESDMAAGRVAEAQATNLAIEQARGGWENPPAGQRIRLDHVEAKDAATNPGGVTYLIDRDAEVSAFKPIFDQEVERVLSGAPEGKGTEAFGELQRYLAYYAPQYRLKALPKGGNPYYVGQGSLILDQVAGKMAAADGLRYAFTSRVADFWHLLFGRVYSRNLNEEAKQELYSDIISKSDGIATPSQVNGFLAALHRYAEESSIGGKSQLFRRGDMIPTKKINEIAEHGFVGKAKDVDLLNVFKGFPSEVIEKIGRDDFGKLMDGAASHFYRRIKEAHRLGDREGRLGRLLAKFYGPATWTHGKTASASHYTKIYYHVFRFLVDPRWHLMNWFESDILGAIRYGFSTTRMMGARDIDPATGRPYITDRATTLMSGGRPVSRGSLADDPLLDSLSGGFLDNRQLEGVIGQAYKVERVSSTRAALKVMARDDPIIVSLRKTFGGSEDEWVEGLERMMYDWDHIGVESTLQRAAKATFDDVTYAEMQPLIDQLTLMHRQILDDVVHTFHGNTNRSNLERILNSYFLFWPISYQLKVAKTLFDVLTHKIGGKQTDLFGVWTLDRLNREHKRRLAEDESYQALFDDHPELWRTAAMLLPITPYDLGVSESRFTRYIQSAVGAHLGLWDTDERYPQDPFTFASRIMQMGPVYTGQLLLELGRETFSQ